MKDTTYQLYQQAYPPILSLPLSSIPITITHPIPPNKTYAHLPSCACALNGSCRSNVLNASVRGVYGTCVFGSLCTCTGHISHSLSLAPLSETGESLMFTPRLEKEEGGRAEDMVCMSSISIFEAARWEELGMREYIPRAKLRRKIALGWPLVWV